MYQLENLETFTSPAYLERLNNPTPWTSRTLPLFVGMNRTLCSVASSHVHGIGGYLLTIQMMAQEPGADRLRAWLSGEILPTLAARPGHCGAHLLIGDRAVRETKTQEKVLRGEPDAVADWIVLVEGYDRTALENTRADLCGANGLVSQGAAEEMVSGLYSLDFTLDEDEAKR